MDGELRLGYQLAEICVQTTLFGRQWLSARQHPGSTVSGPCLLSLIEDAERRLNGHPRRRTELVEQRLAAGSQTIAEEERLAVQQEQRSLQQIQRLERLAIQIQTAQAQIDLLQAGPRSSRQGGPYSQLSRLQTQGAGWRRQQERATAQRVHADTVESGHRARAQTLQHARDQLQTYLERLCQENVDEATLVPCTIRLDAGFSSGENLTALIEKGYDLETKSGNDALVQALRKQASDATIWTRVGKNAEMIGWTNYHIHTCPYPLTVALERFSTPRGRLHAVLIRNQETPQTPCPDLAAWFPADHARQTIEAGNKEEKTTFKVQHLLSRSAAGIEIQALLTVFAANVVRWASAWVRARVECSRPQVERILNSPTRLVRGAANSPATIDPTDGCVRVCFSPLSGLNGVVVCVSGTPDLQLSLPVLTKHQFSSA